MIIGHETGQPFFGHKGFLLVVGGGVSGLAQSVALYPIRDLSINIFTLQLLVKVFIGNSFVESHLEQICSYYDYQYMGETCYKYILPIPVYIFY